MLTIKNLCTIFFTNNYSISGLNVTQHSIQLIIEHGVCLKCPPSGAMQAHSLLCTDCTADHLLIKTVPFLDVLAWRSSSMSLIWLQLAVDLLYEDWQMMCADVNECQLGNPCPGHRNNMTCRNTPGSFTCSCPRGFRFNPRSRHCEGNEPKLLDVVACSIEHIPIYYAQNVNLYFPYTTQYDVRMFTSYVYSEAEK